MANDIKFFIRRFKGEPGSLTVWIGGEERDEMIIEFQFVQSVLQYKEGHFYERMAGYKARSEVYVASNGSDGVFEVENTTIGALIPDRLRDEKPQVYLVETADHCIEVLSFERPTVREIG